MKTKEELQQIAIQVIRSEREAVAQLEKKIGNAFSEAVELLYSTPGRVVVTGIGKSANIATKIVSTLNSTGTPALFLHAADAIHGDLGMVRKDDTVICLSKSGNTPEIKVLVPLLKQFGNKLIAIVGNTDSFLASEADIVLDTTVEHEACPNNLAPTSSTTAQLVMGDALAVALIECRNFTASDFARFHPGGALGKQLYMRVSDLSVQNEKPQVSPDTPVREVILEMTSKRLGCAVVVEDGKPTGIITDGDLRRMLNRDQHVSHLKARDIMTVNPKYVVENEYAVNALHIMQQRSITQLIVVDPEGLYNGVVHLHDILREGII
ncbi:MAG: KpsF/GutQ family sugar-phosphate isomerase [Bacteroidales bacterium]|nr:KpsF/GutQ family sugar-phosphate isomerase [Bacteroidales bacterium]MBO4751490.1 KpsF/GutQ family sugar-phosphate isomerase [Bacteroidales bacterium]